VIGFLLSDSLSSLPSEIVGNTRCRMLVRPSHILLPNWLLLEKTSPVWLESLGPRYQPANSKLTTPTCLNNRHVSAPRETMDGYKIGGLINIVIHSH